MADPVWSTMNDKEEEEVRLTQVESQSKGHVGGVEQEDARMREEERLGDAHRKATSLSNPKRHNGSATRHQGQSHPEFPSEHWILLKDPWARSRILYPNPVSILTTRDEFKLNAMIVTWIMAADNNGGVIASINRKRHSAIALQRPSATFTLSIPTKGMEDLVLSIGTCTGAEVDKFSSIPGLASRKSPWNIDGVTFPEAVQHDSIVAVLSCSVSSVVDGVDAEHMTVMAKTVHAVCRKTHWDGKCFAGSPPILAFLGSKRFADTIDSSTTSNES